MRGHRKVPSTQVWPLEVVCRQSPHLSVGREGRNWHGYCTMEEEAQLSSKLETRDGAFILIQWSSKETRVAETVPGKCASHH